MPRNIDVTPDPGKGRERNVEGISPFRGIPDVTPMPRRGVMDEAQARNLAHAIQDMTRTTMPPDRDGITYAEYRQTPTLVIRIRENTR